MEDKVKVAFKISFGTTDQAIVRSLIKLLRPEALKDPAKRAARHEFYRAVLTDAAAKRKKITH